MLRSSAASPRPRSRQPCRHPRTQDPQRDSLPAAALALSPRTDDDTLGVNFPVDEAIFPVYFHPDPVSVRKVIGGFFPANLCLIPVIGVRSRCSFLQLINGEPNRFFHITSKRRKIYEKCYWALH